MRHDRLNHARQGNLLKNLEDFFKRQHHTSDPEICKIIYNDQPKKRHHPLPPSVAELVENPGDVSETPSLDDSFTSSCIGIPNVDENGDVEGDDLEENPDFSITELLAENLVEKEESDTGKGPYTKYFTSILRFVTSLSST